MRFKLTAKENRNTGEIGWLDSRIPRGSEAFEPLTGGLGLAHDCLEHSAFGSVADEIEAHGAMYRIRYEGGWSSQYGQTLDMAAFAYEWSNLYLGLQQEPFLPTPPKTQRLDETIEEDISSIIEKGKFAVRNEHPECDDGDLDRIANVFRAYFRRGYRNVAKRFKGLAGCEIAALFSDLELAFEHHTPEYEGQELAVTVNVQTQRVSIEEIFAEEY